jgi:hypothetical protein
MGYNSVQFDGGNWWKSSSSRERDITGSSYKPQAAGKKTDRRKKYLKMGGWGLTRTEESAKLGFKRAI